MFLDQLLTLFHTKQREIRKTQRFLSYKGKNVEKFRQSMFTKMATIFTLIEKKWLKILYDNLERYANIVWEFEINNHSRFWDIKRQRASRSGRVRPVHFKNIFRDKNKTLIVYNIFPKTDI